MTKRALGRFGTLGRLLLKLLQVQKGSNMPSEAVEVGLLIAVSGYQFFFDTVTLRSISSE